MGSPSNSGKQAVITSTAMLTDTDAPGDAPRRAEMDRSELVMISVP